MYLLPTNTAGQFSAHDRGIPFCVVIEDRSELPEAVASEVLFFPGGYLGISVSLRFRDHDTVFLWASPVAEEDHGLGLLHDRLCAALINLRYRQLRSEVALPVSEANEQFHQIVVRQRRQVARKERLLPLGAIW